MKGFLKAKQLEVLLSLALTLAGAIASMMQAGTISFGNPTFDAMAMLGIGFLARAGASHLQGTDVAIPAAPVGDQQSEEDTLIAAAEAFLAKQQRAQAAVAAVARVSGALTAATPAPVAPAPPVLLAPEPVPVAPTPVSAEPSA